jgi:predicted RNA-binding Zn ribbon-like protein
VSVPHVPENPPIFVADHPVMDFLNTVAAPAGTPIDMLASDNDVLHWLEKAGMSAGEHMKMERGALLHEARELREMLRGLILKRKAGKRMGVAPLNAFLADAISYPQLVAEGKGFAIERHRPTQTVRQMLSPIAESAAELLATGDFDLVRPCEGKDCILWFYDRTKSHRRRWCSMQVCGNRRKVEAFRERQRA